MTKLKGFHSGTMIKYFIGGGAMYMVIVLIVTFFHRPPLGRVLLAIVAGAGAWVICYLYAAKQDIHYASWAAKHGEAPLTRVILLIIALAWILLYPWSLLA